MLALRLLHAKVLAPQNDKSMGDQLEFGPPHLDSLCTHQLRGANWTNEARFRAAHLSVNLTASERVDSTSE